ncbi:MAG: multi-sensor signal transduction histidine kinase [Proteobacteria bacterium]|nr:multi-sensor signal transduction histidine kinase [Pseudomonadota bacterium]
MNPPLPPRRNILFGPAGLALLYTGFAAAWLLVTELVLPHKAAFFGISEELLASFGHLSFVMLTASVLFVLLKKQQQRTAQFLAKADEHHFLLQQFYDLPFVGMAISSAHTHRWLHVNDQLCRILGYSKQELLELDWMAITHPDDLAQTKQLVAQMEKGQRESYEQEKRYIRKDKQLIHVRTHVRCQRNALGAITLFFATVEDITERMHHEEEFRTLNRLYRVVSNINQAIVRNATQEQMFRNACDVCVHDGEFRMAWIGLLQDDGQVKAVAHAGTTGDYLQNLQIALSGPSSTGPTAGALLTGQPVICNDIAQDPGMLPWQTRALDLGYRASAAFPLLVDGEMRGTFNLYADRTDFFDEPELGLLGEVAGDIAFAMRRFDAEKTNQQTLVSLEESQSKLLLAMEAANLSMWDVDLETGNASVSDNYYTLMGFEAQSFPVSLDWWFDRMHPEDREQCQISLRIQQAEKRERMGVEYRFRHNDGSWHWIAGTGRVITRNADGIATRLVGVNMDITRRIERDLQHARDAERANGLLALATAESALGEKALLQYGLDLAEKLTESKIGFLHFVNEDQQTIELVTWSTATLKQCEAVADTHYPISQAGIWTDCFHQRQPVICNDYAALTMPKGLPEGHVPLQRFVVAPTLDENKVQLLIGVGNRSNEYTRHEVDTVQLIANDLWRIIQRRRMEAALQENLQQQLALNTQLEDAHNQLLQSEKLAAIGQLAAGVAHELNNPISFVHSNLGALESYVNDLIEITDACQPPEPCAHQLAINALKQAKDYDYIRTDLPQLINESKEGLSRVRQIVQDLKDFSRAGESNWDWADLHSGLDSTLNIVWNELKYKCTVHKEYGDLPKVYCLPSQLNQVFMNILVNASHAIEDKGEITLRTGTVDDRAWVEITDTGKGIAPEHLTKIFDPFFTTKPVGQGTGLGLSLSYSIMQRHHGSLTVRSKVGVGTTFRIQLPIQPDHAPQDIHQEKQYE